MGFKKILNIVGWIVFAIATIVYFLSAESTGSLWDCGEFIAGAYKLEVVHPPGASLFVLIGRMFVLVAEIFTDTEAHPENISFAVNLMSGICTAFTALFVCWTTGIFSKIALVGRQEEPNEDQIIPIAGAALAGGLTAAFCSSIWFSAVEGEVYALSTMFTALVVWSMAKWYNLPDNPHNDRWVVFAIYMAGLSIGVHLLSLLTFPALGILYYLKKYKDNSLLGMLIAAVGGVLVMGFIQITVILGVPKLWSFFEFFAVNSLGMPIHSGIIFVILLFAGLLFFGFRMAHQRGSQLLQNALVALTLVLVGFSTIGVIVIRANAKTPISMNSNTNVMRLIPYLNREQYGERPLLYGPHYAAEIKSVDKVEDRYDYDEKSGTYKIVDQKLKYVYDNKDKMPFPRLSHSEGSRPVLYQREWDISNPPTFGENLWFFMKYQVGWMYVRYFMWNFSGRQNGEQGFNPMDKSKGHWITGIPFIDNLKLYNQSELPDVMRYDNSRNKYYMLPFIFGLLGFFFLFKNRPNEAFALLVLFFMTGLAIIIYSNQPPREPRERDYVLTGSFFTYSMFVGMGVLAIFGLLKDKLAPKMAGYIATAIVLLAPLLMATQNFDDHSRRGHYGASDYASNFLNSVDQNSIIFTYGDNDTYPLWYAQEVEEIRTDVRVINLSLIQVDWYIDLLRRKVNKSAPIKMTLPSEAYQGRSMVQVPYLDDGKPDSPMNYQSVMNFIASRKDQKYLPTKVFSIPVNKQAVINQGGIDTSEQSKILPNIQFTLPLHGAGTKYALKGDLALLDIIASNINDRPIYFAVTIPDPSKGLLGLKDYTQLEGLALRLVPIKYKPDARFSQMQSMSLGLTKEDKMYDNIMNKWKWGNFDKLDTHINEKYGPSVQSMRIAFLRVIRKYIDNKQNKEAVALIDKYFEAFPNMNFPYDYASFEVMRSYGEAGEWEKTKPHLEILLDNIEQNLNFFVSMDDNILRTSYASDFNANVQTLQNIMALAYQQKDKAYLDGLNQRFAAYKSLFDQQQGRDRGNPVQD